MSCINPCAPLREIARGLLPLSARMTLEMKSASTSLRALASLTMVLKSTGVCPRDVTACGSGGAGSKFSIWALGTSTYPLLGSALMYRRVISPFTSCRSWRMLKPLCKLAISAAYICDAINKPRKPSCKNLRIHARCIRVEYLFDGRRHSALVVMQSDGPAVLLQVVRCISHDDRMAGEGQHLDVIVIIADGHYLGAIDATIVGPAFQRVSLRASRVEDVDDAQVAHIILRAQHGEIPGEIAGPQLLLRLPHQFDRAAEHGLNGVFRQSFCNGADIFDVGRILLHPALDDVVQTLVIFAHNRPHPFTVEGEHHVVAILGHVPAELDGRFPGQQVLVEQFSARGPRHRPIRAHQPQVEAERLRHGQGEPVPASRNQHDFNAGFMGPAQSPHSSLRRSE